MAALDALGVVPSGSMVRKGAKALVYQREVNKAVRRPRDRTQKILSEQVYGVDPKQGLSAGVLTKAEAKSLEEGAGNIAGNAGEEYLFHLLKEIDPKAIKGGKGDETFREIPESYGTFNKQGYKFDALARDYEHVIKDDVSKAIHTLTGGRLGQAEDSMPIGFEAKTGAADLKNQQKPKWNLMEGDPKLRTPCRSTSSRSRWRNSSTTGKRRTS